MDQITTEAGATDGSMNSQEGAEKTYTQKEFDDAMAKMKHSITNKVLRPYQELGDPEELRALKAAAEAAREEQQLKRGEFEKTLQEKMAAKDAEIQKRDQIIREYRIDNPLLTAAAKYNSVNPEQVRTLLKGSVRLNDQGQQEVVDAGGNVRYDDSGKPIGVDDLVREFLDSNPHFARPTPATTNTKSSVDNSRAPLDISKLDMTNPEHKELYKQHRKAMGLA